MSETAETVLTDIRSELRGMRAEARKDNADLRADIQGVRAELRGELQGVRTELRGELQGLRSDMREDFRLLLNRQDRHFYWVLAALAALFAVMAHGFHWY